MSQSARRHRKSSPRYYRNSYYMHKCMHMSMLHVHVCDLEAHRGASVFHRRCVPRSTSGAGTKGLTVDSSPWMERRRPQVHEGAAGIPPRLVPGRLGLEASDATSGTSMASEVFSSAGPSPHDTAASVRSASSCASLTVAGGVAGGAARGACRARIARALFA
jgi:hypothetical protein